MRKNMKKYIVILLLGWLVTYTWNQQIHIACPQPEPMADEFGRVKQVWSTFAIACFETINHPKQRRFDSYDEAMSFVERGQKEFDLSDFVIEQED